MKPHSLWTRRDVVQSMAIAGAAATVSQLVGPTPLRALAVSRHSVGGHRSVIDPTIVIDSTDVRDLAMRAVDAAKAAGATYADVRLTRELTQGLGSTSLANENERICFGVRVLIDGGWGFASSPYWEPEEAVSLARQAATQAKANVKMGQPVVPWTPIPVASGFWATPIKFDPFVVPLEERMDTLKYWEDLAYRYRGCYSLTKAVANRLESVVATTDGAYFGQTTYRSGGDFTLRRYQLSDRNKWRSATAAGLELTAAGWEIFAEAEVPHQIPELYDAADPYKPLLPVKPGNVGRYDVVFDAGTMGKMLDNTIGTATQLDRAVGSEANAGGTSYLGPDPLTLLGTYQAASSLVNITANRSMHRGAGSVKWDDEGVEPDNFALVDHGVLVDYQTTREQASWLAPWYQKTGKAVHSHGCAAAPDGMAITMQHAPNLVLEPGGGDIGFADLVADTKRGFAVMGASIATDFQQQTGFSRGGLIRRITDGKLGEIVANLSFQFNATEFWKNIKALGGAGSTIQYVTYDVSKGQPSQTAPHSTRAVPAKVTDVYFIDLNRG